jgi:hypothetical protein
MSYRFACLIAIIVCVPVSSLPAQAGARSNPVGTWRGTSLCQVRGSPCHDEIVIYRITRTTTRDSLQLDARKIVNGAEEEMGILGCRFNTTSAQLTCVMPNGVWHFMLHADSLVGDLRLQEGTKYRDVRTVRSR